MRYIVSDIHGCYKEYKELLDKIRFSEKDELYVLGDAMDRGPEPIKVIRDMMMRPNVIYIVGNHDYVMLSVLRRLAVDITEENLKNLESEDLLLYSDWILDGGGITAKQFRALTREEQQEVLAYVSEALTYAVLKNGKEEYVLVHAGISSFEESRPMDDYEFWDFLCERADYGSRYYQDHNRFLVTGHTPTSLIRRDGKAEVYQEHGHIAVDCGCVFGGNLAAYCIETGEVFYVEGRKYC